MAKVQEIHIPLSRGISQQGVQTIQHTLSQNNALASFEVAADKRSVRVQADNIGSILPAIVRQLNDAGYPVVTTQQSFPVLGMACAACAIGVQDVIIPQVGIVQAQVNYATATMMVEYIPSLISPAQLKSSLQAAGYDLVIEEEEQAKEVVEEYKQHRKQSIKQNAIGAMLFALPVIVIGMTPSLMHMEYANYIMWALSTPVVLYYGRSFFVGAYKQWRNRTANMDTLVALSTGTAYLFSVFNLLFEDFWHERGLQGHVYFEAAAAVIAFVLVGKLLEERAKDTTSSALKKLIGLQPKSVTIVNAQGQLIETPISAITIGDRILIKAGEKVAVDGVVVEGNSYVDESMLSGEPIAVAKLVDSWVYAGTLNQKGSFVYQAKKVGSDTLLAHIIKMVEDAQGSKPPVQKLVDKIAGIFVPAVLLIALVTLVIWSIWGGEDGISQGVMAMVTVLVIACPCALGLATPTAIMVGIGKGAENGILIKDAQSLETAHRIDAVILDKTGTITEGKPQVTGIQWLSEENQPHLKDILYTIEKSSEHPLAEAITTFLQQEGSSTFLPHVTIENIVGEGIKGMVAQEEFLIGNLSLVRKYGVALTREAEEWIQVQEELAHTVVAFFSKTELLAIVAIADQIKPTSIEAVRQLHQQGIEVYMLTGDNKAAAAAVASQVGITHYQANVLPADKAHFVEQLQQQGKIVAMVGDGINDSNALAKADISIAMGRGSDIAMDVAQMTIISSDLAKIEKAIILSKQTVKTIHQNLFWAFIYNIIGIPLAAGVLYPVNGFLLDPMIAGAAMALSSVSVISNSIRLKWMKI